MKDTKLPPFDDVDRGRHERISPISIAHRLLTSSYLNDLSRADLHFKCENSRRQAAFKVAGAAMRCSRCRVEAGARRCHPFQRKPRSCRGLAAGRRGIRARSVCRAQPC